MQRLGVLVLAGWALFASSVGAEPPERNGFVLESRAIDPEEVRTGGPPRDGIPALDDPATVSVSRSPWEDDEWVIGVAVGGEARAYPLSILVWHELVNDEVGGVPLLVSYCPLCGTGMVFDRRVGGEARRFGVSGLLYRSDLLFFDRETESLWSQIAATAVTGPSEGQRLDLLRSRMLPWKEWRERHPDTGVLSRQTGHARRYGHSPYGDYARSERLLFPTAYDTSYHPKTPTLGLRVPGGPARAYPAGEVVRAGGRVEERFGGHPVVVRYDPEQQLFRVSAPDAVEAIEGYWFAWSAFHPETSVFRADPDGPER